MGLSLRGMPRSDEPAASNMEAQQNSGRSIEFIEIS